MEILNGVKYSSLSDESAYNGTSSSWPIRLSRSGCIASILSATAVVVLIILGAIVGIFGTLLAVRHSSWCSCSSNECHNPSTPLWTNDLHELNTAWTRFNGSLYGSNQYRGLPSKELDHEWDRFTDHEWMPGTPYILGVGELDIRRSRNDFSKETIVELDEENGGGYMATMELFHQLHCLNVLRKWTHLSYYQDNDPFWHDSNQFHLREHTDHCIDMLRQALMCSSDTGLILFHWTKLGTPSPYFSTSHKCRNPEEVLAWGKARANTITHHVWKKGGEKEWDESPA